MKPESPSTTGAPERAGQAVVNDVAAARPRGRVRRLVLSGTALAIAGLLLAWVITNERFEWPVVASYLFAPYVLKGVVTTLWLTAICMVLGVVFGIVLALMKLSSSIPLRVASNAFIWFFRAVPMLVQLIFWFNLSYLLPRVVVGVPFGPEFFSWNTNDLINATTAAIIGLTIHESVYMAEIIRAGILSVDSGQRDAALAIGMTPGRAFRRTVLPQAMRVIVPPTGSQVISLLKGTSLVSVIGMTDLLHATQVIYSRTFEVVPLLMVASVWYLFLVGILSIAQTQLERRLGRGQTRSSV